MPYLNWKERPELRPEISEPVPGTRQRMQLHLTAELRAELRGLLAETLGQGGIELRVDLPSGWIVFWKRREAESRLLVAHPQPGEWVVTVALHEEHAGRLLSKLEAGEAAPIHLSELGEGGGPDGAPFGLSNVELILRLG